MKAYLFFTLLMMQQVITPHFAADFKIHEGISEEIKHEIIENAMITLSKYENAATFWNAKLNQFDEQKYNEYIQLFSGDAEVLDELRFTDKMIHYSDYAQLVYENLQKIGVPFDLKDVIINSIDIDETGFYIIDMNITKRIYSGLTQTGNSVELKKGRKVKLNLRIDFPDYLLSDARIQYIQPAPPKRFKAYVKQPINFVSEKLKRN